MRHWTVRSPGLIPAHAGKTPSVAARRGTARAHPRSRGENDDLMTKIWPEEGSSPLTRGKLRLCCNEAVRVGLIPAHAGKTSSAENSRCCSPAHPRSRGENLVCCGFSLHGVGSSPLTRGKLLLRSGSRTPKRLIPAHAGKTPTPSRRCKPSPAHPRSRGENYATQRNPVRPTGSSPLTRGKQEKYKRQCDENRLIPAHAGKTATPLLRRLIPRAHPRSRGENC